MYAPKKFTFHCFHLYRAAYKKIIQEKRVRKVGGIELSSIGNSPSKRLIGMDCVFCVFEQNNVNSLGEIATENRKEHEL